MAKTKTTQSNNNAPSKRWLLISGSAILLALAAFLLPFVYTGDTKPIRQVADQLKAPSNWTLQTEQIEPPRLVCLGDNPCPSLQRTWKIGNEISKLEFKTILENSDLHFPVEGSCQKDIGDSGTFPVCTAEGRSGQFILNVALWDTTSPSGHQQVILNIR